MIKSKIIYCILFTLLIVLAGCSNHQHSSALQPILGTWQGEFMPGNNFLLTLSFETMPNGKISGRIHLQQGDVEIQDDPLSKIKLYESELSFYIADKETPFKGMLNTKEQTINGFFHFPDGSQHELTVKKIAISQADTDLANKLKFDPIKRVYTSEELHQDLTFLIDQLKTNHPQLFLYQTKRQFSTQIEQIKKSIQPEMHEDEFLQLIAPLIADIGCSHTICRHSSDYLKALAGTQSFFPLTVQFLDNAAFVIQNHSANKDIHPGTQILAINGQSLKQIRKKLFTCIPADAHNNSFKQWMLNNRFTEMYSMYIGNSKSYTFDCAYQGKTFSVQLAGLSLQKLQATLQQTQKLPYRYELIPDIDAALLTINNFMAPDFEDYQQFLADFFDQLDASTLLIDVRGNMGGRPEFSTELLTWLMPSSFLYFQVSQNPEFRTLQKMIQPQANAFRGTIYVLVNGGCLSTTGHFLSLVKYHQLGTLVGENSGASFSCNDNSITTTLPNTGIQVNIARTVEGHNNSPLKSN